MKNMSVEEFFNGNQMKIDIFKSKYAKNGETPYECFNRIANEISKAYFKEGSSKQIYWSNRWTDEMMSDKFRPGGSIIASTNNPDKKISIFNCTGFKIPEDTLEAIYQTRYEVSKSAAHRQGCGIEFSNLRPKGSPVNNSAEVSEGVTSWMRSFDRIADEVGQKGRKPAMLFALKIDHPDVIDFISCKDDLDSINNANISIQITDKFMAAVKNDDPWVMSFPISNDKNNTMDIMNKVVPAKKLLNMIAEHSHASAEPGLLFIDRMKDGSMQEALGYDVTTSNACSEKALPEFGVCCLSSINMAKVPPVESGEFKAYIKNITESLVMFMDNVNEYEINNSFKSPLDKQLDMVKDLREIGLGVTNIHQWLYDQDFAYDSIEGITAIETFFKWYYYYSFLASVNLAKERGTCPAWESMFYASDRPYLKDSLTPFLQKIFNEFPDLEQLYTTSGIRNGSLLSIAPTGSLSLTFRDDVLSTGIEPLIGRAYWQKTRANTKGNYYEYYFKIPDTIRNLVMEKMENIISENVSDDIELMKETQEDFEILNNFTGGTLDKDGTIGEELIEIIEKYVPKKLLSAAHEIDPFKKIEMMGKIQSYIDAAISVTFNLPHDFPVEQVEELYIKAHAAGLKGLSIYRDGSREGIMIFKFPKSTKDKEIILSEIDKKRPDEIIYRHAPKRPKTLPCEIFKALKHYVLIGLLKDKPYESFLIDTDIKLPEEGHIVKKSKKRYVLTDNDGNVLLDNLIDRELISDEIKTISRLTSMALRGGEAIEHITDQLSLCPSDDNNYPKAVGKVLKKYNRLSLEILPDGKKCPVCGELLIKYGGCMICITDNCSGGGACDI